MKDFTQRNEKEQQRGLMKGEIHPEINFVCQKETGVAFWRHYRHRSISVVCLSWMERQEFLGEQLRASGHQIHISHTSAYTSNQAVKEVISQ